MEYTVTWDIQLEADTPKQAATLALEIQRDVSSEAVCFVVQDATEKQYFIDLSKD